MQVAVIEKVAMDLNTLACCKMTMTIMMSMMMMVKVRERYVDLYSTLGYKHLVFKALRQGSHNLTCKQHDACL